ncbi:MAG: hypothetical protein JWN17_961 [Frankiales bacterium]|nr:hypothetical protein [Frankiales bacterium]
MDPYCLPCHPDNALTAQDRDWRAVGVRTEDAVLRKQTRCPTCKTSWTAFQRTVGAQTTVEWVRPVPFLVQALALPGDDVALPLWQDASVGGDESGEVLAPSLQELQEQTSALGASWERSVQRVAPVQVLTAGGAVFAVPGDVLLERREKWNAQDRRLALLWSPRLGRQVVAWHGVARLLQDDASQY